jgi:hypothetical protein
MANMPNFKEDQIVTAHREKLSKHLLAILAIYGVGSPDEYFLKVYKIESVLSLHAQMLNQQV